MEYIPTPVEAVIAVKSIVTVHYFQFARGYLFDGEEHDFWEFVYMDKGAAEIGADGRRFLLSQGEAVLHQPGEFHTIWAGGDNPPDIAVISFVCLSPAMERFRGLRVAVDEEGRALIAQVIREAAQAWSNDLSQGYARLLARPGGAEGAPQLVRLTLESLLIRLLRSIQPSGRAPEPVECLRAQRNTRASTAEYSKGLLRELDHWVLDHLEEKITVDELCRHARISPTSLKKIFRESAGQSVMQHVSALRHEAALRLIRGGYLSMKAIADKCGYGSIHYFSRQFHKTEGMTPSEYARSVKSRAEDP